MQEPVTHLLDIVAQFALGEAVDRPESVAEFVVEEGSEHAARQGPLHVADALADVIPDVGHFARGRAALQVDEDRRLAGARESAQMVELRRLLKRSLEPLGDLLDRLLGGGARPDGVDDHRLDDEAPEQNRPEPVPEFVGGERAAAEAADRRIEEPGQNNRAERDKQPQVKKGGAGQRPSSRGKPKRKSVTKRSIRSALAADDRFASRPARP